MKLTEEQRKQRDKIVEEHLPLARRLALHYRWATQERDECVAQAYYGLVRAANKLVTRRVQHANPTGYIIKFLRHYIFETQAVKDSSPLEYHPPNYTVSEEETESRIREWIRELTSDPRERSVCYLRVLGYTDREVAALLNLSLSKAHEIRINLQRRIQDDLGRTV